MYPISVTLNRDILKIISFILIISFSSDGCNPTGTGKVRITTEMNIGESQVIKLSSGKIVNLKLLDIKETRDSLRNAVRAAYVNILVDGELIILVSGNYNLPVAAGNIQIDCPVTKGYYSNNNMDFWRLHKDAAFRIWEKGEPLLEPGTFVFPIGQRWFTSLSQLSNEPTYVDGGESAANKIIYYHAPIDFGGSEGMDEIVSATDGLVISAKGEIMAGNENLGLRRQDAKDGVYILDNRNWYVRYSHLDSIFAGIKPGARVRKGQRIGYMGKQGSSGGWVHLHFAIFIKDSLSGEWKVEDAYPYLWESYVSQHKPPLIAVARPHQLLFTNQETTLDGTKSRSFEGDIVKYEWTFCDGTTAEGAVQKKSYSNPGEYSEILKVTDSKGNIDYDFTIIQVYNRYKPDHTIPAMQASYHPSLNIHPGDPVTFLVRTFNTESGNELWNFGDGSPCVAVRSETVDRKNPVKGKFAETIHSYAKAGHYIVSVERTDEAGIKAISHLHVVVIMPQGTP
jgi:murein DD-endopeptidase MepM/ murein hydrolase activator NlpD